MAQGTSSSNIFRATKKHIHMKNMDKLFLPSVSPPAFRIRCIPLAMLARARCADFDPQTHKHRHRNRHRQHLSPFLKYYEFSITVEKISNWRPPLLFRRSIVRRRRGKYRIGTALCVCRRSSTSSSTTTTLVDVRALLLKTQK